MKEDISKLPRWARNRIEKLEADLKHSRKLAESATSPNTSGTDTAVVVYGDAGREYRGLPTGTEVEFRMGEDRRVRVRMKDGQVYVWSEDGALSILPSVSNAVHVDVVDR
jgi:hypothetical protein